MGTPVDWDPRALMAAVGDRLDLVEAPFTLPGSRLLVFRHGDGIRVNTAEYERRLDDCVVLESLVVRDGSGGVLPITGVLPAVVEFGGRVTLGFDGVSVLSIGLADGRREHATVEWRVPGGGVERAAVTASGAVRLSVADDRRVVVTDTGNEEHATALSASEAVWIAWFTRCPVVRDDLQPMTAFCWWVLGANIVDLPALGGARAVVPSKIGYVGLWQWDAYFIAVGLRHGDPELAREQLDLAFRFPGADGQLPDVVHEHGVLASSDDLPIGDRENLRRAGSQVADPDAAVPLTKPPLAAWALRKVAERGADPAWLRRQLETVRRSQDWWFAASDLDGDGLPEYGHPYSSGLDDSPIFDGPIPTTSPDLAAYLIVQDREIAAMLDGFGETDAAAAHRARAEGTSALLLDLWDADAERFRALGAGRPLPSYAVVSLLPLLTGSLPEAIAARLVAALEAADEFATPWGVPTVAVGDADFSPERMWRGPVWININALLVDGLDASGYPDAARRLAERTVALVQHGGGPHEYFNPYTGEKAATATTAFGWSAALFVDLAVRLSA
ncbi:MAG: hypothetical protein ABWY36_08490 [Leifsonia sp.]